MGSFGALGLSLSAWSGLPRLGPPRRRTSRACILVWLDGGPSHLDTFDPKPDAPREVRGPFKPIRTSVPGLLFSELLPRTAQIAHHFTVIRSMTSPLGEHNFGSHYLLTGHKPSPALSYPSIGSVVARCSGDDHVLPAYIAVGDRLNGMAGAGYLPARYAPFVLGGDPAKKDFAVRDLDPYPGVDASRLARRQRFLGSFDEFQRAHDGSSADSASPEFEQAMRLMTSPDARDAFDLGQEPAQTRARYGPRTIGQSCLLARRLVERGVPFVTVTDTGWDTHKELSFHLKEGHNGGHVGKIPMLDLALSGLVGDLADRGLLDETLVIVMGEFGRTPKLNSAGGRDHWPRVFSVLVAGAGVPGGQVVGASDAVGESPVDRPVTPSDLARTVFTILGIDPEREFVTTDGRPVAVNKGGELVEELLG